MIAAFNRDSGMARAPRDDREERRARMSAETLTSSPTSSCARRPLARDRGLREKVMSLEEAATLVNDGDHVGIGGCTMSRTPIAMIWALIRAARKDLTVSRSIASTEGDLLFASGVSKHIITSWFSQGIVWGVSKVMRHYTENEARPLRGVEPHVDGPALPRRRHGHALHAARAR